MVKEVLPLPLNAGPPLFPLLIAAHQTMMSRITDSKSLVSVVLLNALMHVLIYLLGEASGIQPGLFFKPEASTYFGSVEL